MNIHIKLPSPHSDTQSRIFQAFDRPGTETWVACGTKFGKTISGSTALSKHFPIKKQGLWRWVAPIYSQALIGHRNIERMMPPRPFVEPLQYSIKIPSTKSTIEFRSGEKPENLEGEACSGYVLDECAKMREQVYSSAKTTVTLTRGPILAISTPRGKNWFYNKCMQAKAEMELSLAKGEIPTRIFITAPTVANPRISAEIVAEAKKSLPDRLFRKYY